MEFIGSIIITIIVIVFILYQIAKPREYPMAGSYERIARNLTKSHLHPVLAKKASLAGSIEGFKIRAEFIEDSHPEAPLFYFAHHNLSLSFPQALPFDFHLYYFHSRKKKGTILGDHNFDQSFILHNGDEIILTAIFDQNTIDICNQLRDTVHDHFSIEKTGIEYYLKKNQSLELCIERLVTLARQITNSFDLAERLYQGFHHWKHEVVRARCLAYLIMHYPRIVEERHLYEQAMADASSLVNFQAFLLCGEKHMWDQLRTIWGKSDTDLQMQILDYLAKKSDAGSLHFLIIHYKDANYKIRLAILKVIECISDPAANDFLLAQLKGDEERILMAVIAALGACGNPHVINQLVQIRDRTLTKSVKKAIQSICSRMNITQTGQLSIANTDTQEGELSLSVADQEGALAQKMMSRPLPPPTP